MPKTKISEFSATPANNTDIDSINIAEGCAPSGINDAIRELMAQLKDFQTGAVGDSFNGPVGTTTAAAGAFTTLSSTGNTTLGDASGDSVTINGTATFANANPTLSAGTANGVAYLNGSKVVTSGSALTFDGTKLDVVQSGAGSGGALIRVFNTTDGVGAGQLQLAKFGSTASYGPYSANTVGVNAAGTNLLFGTESNHPVIFYQSNAEQMRLTSTGLGIGTSSPQSTYKLTLSGTDSVFPAVYLDNTTNSKAYSMRVTGTSWIIRDNTAGADRLNIDTSGNLGLGVTPTERLHIFKSTYPIFKIESSSYNSTMGIDTGNGNLVITNASNAGLVLSTNNTERARIDSSGNLLVGTTSSAGNAGIQIIPNNGNCLQSIDHITGTATGNFYVSYNFNGSSIGSVTQSGTTAVLYNTTSDQRLKENIQDAESASSLIDSLQVRQFDWKSDNSHQRYGFVAQELVTVAPEAVHQPLNEEDMMAVDYSKLVPMLVKEIQSLRKRLADAGL